MVSGVFGLGKEVEVKAEVGRDLSGRILEVGGSFVREVFQEDLYFRHPCRDFVERDEALRLRSEGGKCMLTFKGRRVGGEAKMREEVEVVVSDAAGVTTLLERLGFERAFVIRKRRKEFLLGGLLVALDDVEGLGKFVEIEGLVKEGLGVHEVEAIKEGVFKVSERLGIQKERLTTESYLEMLVSKSSSSKHLR
ncbi:MAG: class IV adenylate cyclase [Candidatus Methanomethylicaceae archaeon]